MPTPLYLKARRNHAMAEQDPASALIARTVPGVSSIEAAQWDACAKTDDPFLSHIFLSSLEESGSVGPGTGWQASPILIDGTDGAPVGCLPAYLKGHSQGEYVFDHAWADAWQRAGGHYYPKLQIAVPFTPVTGRRLLLREDAAPEIASGLIAAAEQFVVQNNLSSAHATFIAPEEVPFFEAAGWPIREDSQVHFEHDGYADLEEFLARLSSEKRKNLRKERRRARQGLEIVHLTGDAIHPEHWDAFWVFYQDTGSRKWGRPYLTRAFFDLIGARMAEKIVLIFALRGGRPIAGALNFIGRDTLYGRYWGCTEDVPFLHFELCYYQAIDFALAHGLKRVEAGAQGGHKLVRGYKPVATWSAHYIPHPDFRRAVAQFLRQEREAVSADREWLSSRTPFKKED